MYTFTCALNVPEFSCCRYLPFSAVENVRGRGEASLGAGRLNGRITVRVFALSTLLINFIIALVKEKQFFTQNN